MSLHRDMLQAARLAPQALGESTDLVRRFLQEQQTEAGGFKDRTGRGDLYYTVFGLDGLMVVSDRRPEAAGGDQAFVKAANYLGLFQQLGRLDFVHLCCLARGLASLQMVLSPPKQEFSCLGRKALLTAVERFRSRDGGYHSVPGSDQGSVYGCFLALGAYQDCQSDLPDPGALSESLAGLRTPDGGWANGPKVTVGGTNATAAAMTVLRQLGIPVASQAVDWLLGRAHPQGGFLASPTTPMPDLLSTATALHALRSEDAVPESVREKCLDFLDTLWTNDGGFFGHWADDHLDVEYTFYGLLALGHLI